MSTPPSPNGYRDHRLSARRGWTDSVFSETSRPRLGRRRKRGAREQALGRSRGGFTCKVHCLSDANGLPLAFHLTPGEAPDCTAFEDVRALADAKPRHLIADKGYDSDAIRESLIAEGIRPVIPPRSNRKATIRWNKQIYLERNRIERMIGHLKIHRAVATRYDKLARSFLDVLHLAAIRPLPVDPASTLGRVYEVAKRRHLRMAARWRTSRNERASLS